jgi:very-short-patch-repair endonuclease
MNQAGRFVTAIGTKTVPLAADEVIGALAGDQHGVVGRSQLLAAGVGSRAIVHRVESGRLHPLYRGVYAVGHRVLSQRGRWMAATLAADGVLSHRSAGALWDIRQWQGRIDITTPRTRAKRPGLLLHRAVLAPDEITVRDGIPVTTPARTLLDLAGVLQRHQLQQAINEAEILRLPGPHHLASRYPTKRGTRALRALAPPTHTKRDLEARFHTFLNDRRFPRPQTNTIIEGREVDFAWPDHRLIVELDSWEFHRHRNAFEGDRERDFVLTLAKYRVVRITWRQLTRHPETVIQRLRDLLWTGSAPSRRSTYARRAPR